MSILEPIPNYKLFMILLGSKAPQRNVEQHDFFFAIAKQIKDLIPEMKSFWPDAGASLHIDGWREVNWVDGYQIKVLEKSPGETQQALGLFFINLGGYTAARLEEQHYTILTVQKDRAEAIKYAKSAAFYKTNSMKGATSHIDDKYGIDVDDLFRIEDILLPSQKKKFQIKIIPCENPNEDVLELGYFKLDKLENGEY